MFINNIDTMLTIIIRDGEWPRAAGSSIASFCWLGRVWQQGREKSGASTLREVLFSKADSPSWWPDEDLKQLTWKSFPGNDNIQFYIHHFSFPKFSFCAFWNFHSVLDKESQELKVLVPNKFRSKTSLWLQFKFKRSWQPQNITIIVTWVRSPDRVKLDCIRNSCDVLLVFSGSLLI